MEAVFSLAVLIDLSELSKTSFTQVENGGFLKEKCPKGKDSLKEVKYLFVDIVERASFSINLRTFCFFTLVMEGILTFIYFCSSRADL